LAAGYPDAKVTSAETDASWLTLTSHPVTTSAATRAQNIEAIDSYEIEWTGEGATPGNLSSKIVLHIQKDNEEQESQILEIPISGYLAGDVDIVPSNIVFGRVTQNEVVRTSTLTFKTQSIDAAKITCVADHDFIELRFEPSNAPNRFVLTATITPPVKDTNQLVEGRIVGIDESGEVIFSVPYVAFFDTSM
jgi:hypothetical protein